MINEWMPRSCDGCISWPSHPTVPLPPKNNVLSRNEKQTLASYASAVCIKLNAKDTPSILPTNSQQVKLTNVNKEAPCPSNHTKQGQISCADFGHPVVTNLQPNTAST